MEHEPDRTKWLAYERARPEQLRATIDRAPVAYVPLGALEWHGPHLPLGLDGIKARAICERAAAISGGVVFPPIFWGAFDTMPFPFTFHFQRADLRRLLQSALGQLDQMGFRAIVLLSGHYPPSQVAMLKKLCRAHNRDRRMNSIALGVPEQLFAIDLHYYGDHAARWETSLMLATDPSLVDLEALPPGLDSARRMLDHGVMGQDPRANSSPDEGRRALDLISSRLAAAVARVLADGTDAAFEDIYPALNRAIRRRPLAVAYEAFGVRSIPELVKWLWLSWRLEAKVKGKR